jgi:hypothetical protein
MSKKFVFVAILVALLAFIIPIEHKYDKFFRHFSLTLIPQGLQVSKSYDKKIYFYLSDLIAIALLFTGLFWYRIPIRRFFGNCLWIVWICALFSIMASPFSHYPVAYFRLLQLFTPIVLFSFIANAFSDDEKKKMTRIFFWAIALAGLFQTVLAILQYFHQEPLGLRILGEVKERPVFMIENGSRWFIDHFLSRKASPVVLRASGTLPHSNVLGGFLVFSILCSFALWVYRKKRFWLFLIPLQLFAMALSFSRAALLACFLASIIWFFSMKKQKIKELGMILAMSLLLTSILLFKQYSHRGGLFNQTELAKGLNPISQMLQNLFAELLLTICSCF